MHCYRDPTEDAGRLLLLLPLPQNQKTFFIKFSVSLPFLPRRHLIIVLIQFHDICALKINLRWNPFFCTTLLSMKGQRITQLAGVCILIQGVGVRKMYNNIIIQWRPLYHHHRLWMHINFLSFQCRSKCCMVTKGVLSWRVFGWVIRDGGAPRLMNNSGQRPTRAQGQQQPSRRRSNFKTQSS